MSRLTDAEGGWVTSVWSSGNGNCVEVARTPDGVVVRDSKDRNGPVLAFSDGEWNAFVAGTQNGQFNLR